MKPPWTPDVEPSARWIRARVGETVLADSRRAMLSPTTTLTLPTYALPAEDVRTERFTPTAGAGTEDFLVDHDIDVDGRVLTRAARLFGTRLPRCAAWTATGRSPGTRVWPGSRRRWRSTSTLGTRRSGSTSCPASAMCGSRSTARSSPTPAGPMRCSRVWLPTRWYLPPVDVNEDLLVASDTTSDCPYKGHASYWSVQTATGLHPDVLWTYTDPIVECPRIAGLISFFNGGSTWSSTASSRSDPSPPGPTARRPDHRLRVVNQMVDNGRASA